MADGWQDDDNLMGSAIERVVRRLADAPIETLPSDMQIAILDRPIEASAYVVIDWYVRKRLRQITD